MDRRRYTFVTVGFCGERGLLKLQARSMRLYCPTGLIEEIIIVDNSPPPVSNGWYESVMYQYGKLAEFVRFIPGSRLFQTTSDTSGWWIQQVLKIKVSEIVGSDRYVLLDAKNHLINPLNRDFLEIGTGQPRINGHSFINDPMRDFLDCTLKYLGVDPAPHLEWFTRTTTPFTMLTREARELARYLDHREGDRIILAFQERKLTEFFLYSGFLLSKGLLNSIYELNQPHSAQIWGETADLVGCEKAIQKAERSQSPFMAVHTKAIASMDKRSRLAIAKFWHARGLFPLVSDGVRFLRDPNRSHQFYGGRVVPWPIAPFFGGTLLSAMRQ
jgi:Family of unknown function (DUF6492)